MYRHSSQSSHEPEVREGRNCASLACGVSRRELLTSLAAAGAGLILPAGQLWSQTASPDSSGDPSNRIDVHHHIIPPPYLNRERDRILAAADPSLGPRILAWKPAQAIEEMDRNGIATAITSISNPGIWMGNVQSARSLARACNEYAAQMVRDYPGRFGIFAALPLPDPDGSLREIEYALDVLKADGFGLMTSYEDRWPGDPAYAPVFEELNRRKAVVYFHPLAPACCRGLIPDVPEAVMEFLFDTTRAITSLLFSGTFTRYPDIRFIFSHAGGAMPALAGRVEGYVRRHSELAPHLPNGVLHELKRLHFDLAVSVNPATMAALRNLVPIEQMLFGSDFPYMDIPVTAGALDRFALSPAERQAINHENAARLFPRLKA